MRILRVTVAGVSDILYHATQTSTLLDILKEDKLRMSADLGSEYKLSSKLTQSEKFRPYYLSLSRSKFGGYARTIKPEKLSIIELDGRKLKQKYAGTPYDYWGPSYQNPEFHDVDSRLKHDESEDRIFSTEPFLTPLSKYILSIHVMLPEPYVRLQHERDSMSDAEVKEAFVIRRQYEEIVRAANVHHLKVYFYEKFSDFKIQNKRKAITDMYALSYEKDINKVNEIFEAIVTGNWNAMSEDAKKLTWVLSYQRPLEFMSSAVTNSKKDALGRIAIDRFVAYMRKFKLRTIPDVEEFFRKKYAEHQEADYQKRIKETASHNSDMAKLKKDTVITVFHASGDSEILEFVENGIDGKRRTYRKYPHYIGDPKGGKPFLVNRGLFVASDLKTALSFGRCVIKFKATPKTLLPIFPSPDAVHRDNDLYRKHFPHSDYPALSAYLTGVAWKTEPQALYRGNLSPRAIEMVYLYGDDYFNTEEKLKQFDIPYRETKVPDRGYKIYAVKPQDFIRYYKENNKNGRRDVKTDFYFEPQEKVTTVEQFVNGLKRWYIKEYGSRKKDLNADSAIDSFMKHFVQDLERQRSYQHQLQTLETLGMGTYHVPHTIAKRLLPKILEHYKIEKKPQLEREPERYHGF